jgi:putative ABC transport system permease protein
MPDHSKIAGSPRAQSNSDWRHDLHQRLAPLRLTPEREAEIVEELSQHLDDRCEELRAAGASDADARRQAIEELSRDGGLAARMQALAQARTPLPVVHGQPSRSLVRGISQDVVYAVRAMRRQPGVALTIVVTLALGIAVNMTAFTIVNGAALRDLAGLRGSRHPVGKSTSTSRKNSLVIRCLRCGMRQRSWSRSCSWLV